MAVSIVPTDWLTSWAEDATDITLPLASVAGLTAAEADAATGDIRKITYSLLDTLWTKWAGLAEADRPAKMRLKKVSRQDPVSGLVTHDFTFSFITASSGQDVVAE